MNLLAGGRSNTAQRTESPDLARQALAQVLQDELIARLTNLPPHVGRQLGTESAGEGSFDGVRYSIWRHILARWEDWLLADVNMPPVIRRLAHLDAGQLEDRFLSAGLIHIAAILSIVEPPRRFGLLARLAETHANRVISFLEAPPERMPRREVLKARLHRLLTIAEVTAARHLPVELGRQAAAWRLVQSSQLEREHLRRAWPRGIFALIDGLAVEGEPDWRLDEATWLSLLRPEGEAH